VNGWQTRLSLAIALARSGRWDGVHVDLATAPDGRRVGVPIDTKTVPIALPAFAPMLPPLVGKHNAAEYMGAPPGTLLVAGQDWKGGHTVATFVVLARAPSSPSLADFAALDELPDPPSPSL
jgi:hypothetical protein